ncbi:4-hydroxyphenylpyruvate dioxygenase [Sphingomonas sp. LY160]|uniref:4-hydroxyphenylpyruvate dioxygenase n=1 Tax=Sphingomonas sp. LY160 TaxID=3095342 RepID=UPI002ADEE03C|nr:4-hydroxyphenylpyruvate dioxygenase [Sphingomonas sp. LY160]MEA1072173.1 4-hydroxyphenylpyruvate dioxygenase [Sphingomonas sp. LY160]
MATAAPSIDLGPLGLENPMGTDGFEFVEYAAPDPELLRSLFTKMGFPAVAKHKRKNVTLHRQNDINFIINAEPNSFAEQFAKDHGPCACAMAFRVKDANAAHQRALDLGATNVVGDAAEGEFDLKAIEGIGGSRLYFVDRYADAGTIYDIDFDFFDDAEAIERDHASHLTYIDHLTHNVNRGNMAQWAGFYEKLFNFREIRYFDIEGKVTGLFSKAMTSPCGKIRIPLNESQDDKSQIEEFLREYKGEGIQHIALGSDDIVKAVDVLAARGIPFQATPDTYYELLDTRVPEHGEPTAELEKRGILLDGAPTEGQGLLLQIFTQNVIGPIFFEVIQRKGNEGFGEGNFKALFESIELDQIRRGVVDAE